MKQFYLTSIFVLISFFASAQQQPFITTWEVTASDLDITIPTTGTGYNYTVDFGDGTVQNNVTGDATHSYNAAGTYTVSISGTFPRIYFPKIGVGFPNGDVQSIEQWGSIQWQSMEEAFASCYDLVINATDAPDLSQVTNTSKMFFFAESFNQSINHWDVSNVTDMSGMFQNALSFDQPLNNWDVSNVTDMSGMFSNTSLNGTSSFNQPIGNWDVSSVTNMSDMFKNAVLFNQALNNWDVSNVTNMNSMFYRAEVFNQSLNSWDVSNVTNMGSMFFRAEAFNQPLDNWNVGSATTMNGMFWNAYSFDQALNSWDVSNVTDMGYMFTGAIVFDQALDNWNVANVTTMNGMFVSADSFNQALNNWDVSGVTNMGRMFKEADSFNQPLGSWNVSSVTSMNQMFSGADNFNQPLINWDVSNVIEMGDMFNSADSFNQDLTTWQFGSGFLDGFLSNSGLDTNNFDAFLEHLASFGVTNGTLGADGLEYCSQGAHDHLTNNLGWTINGDNLSPNCNMITGTILYDENNNGCDPNDIGTDGIMVNIDDGTYNFSTFTNNGNYTTSVSGNSFTVSVINLPTHYTASPASATVTFTNSNNVQQDFCLTATQSIEDLNITLLPVSQARPGFEADYQLVVKNVGTQSFAIATATLSFDDTKQSFVSSTPAPTSTTANQLTFDLANLQPFETRTINLVMQTFAPPTVNGGDVLDFTATVVPNTNDNTPADNTFVYAQTVVNSFDPNDKQVLQGETISLSQADEYLDYLIRFQNTGTASAINVRILDTLHPKLDYSSIQPVSSSHNYRVEITDGNHVEFIFENINLPHEAADEPGSHGFVAYKIKPKSDVAIGDIITGDARIYFDFNAPIITNTVSTKIMNLGIDEHTHLANYVTVYPNPAGNEIKIHLSQGIVLESVKIHNIQGRLVQSFQGNRETLDISSLKSGMYFIKIETNQGTVNRQLIKE